MFSDYLDVNSIYSNDLNLVLNQYGVEACTKAIVKVCSFPCAKQPGESILIILEKANGTEWSELGSDTLVPGALGFFTTFLDAATIMRRRLVLSPSFGLLTSPALRFFVNANYNALEYNKEVSNRQLLLLS